MSRKTDAIETTHKTYDRIASDYSAKIDRLLSDSWIGQFEQELLDKFLLMTTSANPNILDIGCGNGKDTQYLKQKGAVPISIDISSGMLEEARKRLTQDIFCRMDMRDLGFSDEAFDGAWANGCVYHVPKTDFVQVLREVWRVLRPSGTFSFNFKIGVGEKLEKTPRSFAEGPRFYAYYKNKEMTDFLRRTGFEIIEMTEYPQKIFGERITHTWARKR